jgi:nucleoid-associated protein YgaU
VKSNDTLWKIADGDPAVVKEIQELNKDVLKGKTTLHPGVTLKVPAKTSVASR